VATIQEMKKMRRLSFVGSAQKIKTKKKAKTSGAHRKTNTTDEVSPIRKYKEWRLLYIPYPFEDSSNNISPMTSSQDRSPDEVKDKGESKGLCRNCKKHETCILPKPEGGVWHCKEYE